MYAGAGVVMNPVVYYCSWIIKLNFYSVTVIISKDAFFQSQDSIRVSYDEQAGIGIFISIIMNNTSLYEKITVFGINSVRVDPVPVSSFDSTVFSYQITTFTIDAVLIEVLKETIIQFHRRIFNACTVIGFNFITIEDAVRDYGITVVVVNT